MIGIVIIAGKPIHAGHFALVQYAEKNSDEVVIFTTTSDRGKKSDFIVTGKAMGEVWRKILKKHLDKNTEVVFTNKVVDDVINYINDSEETEFTIFTGSDRENQYSFITKYIDDDKILSFDSIDRTDEEITVDISGTEMREFIANDEKEIFMSYLPDVLSEEEKEDYWNIISTIPLNESRLLDETRNTHSTHLEDLLVFFGVKDGLQKIKKFLNNFIKTKGKEITLKIDGSPAIIFGKNPENGKFFISTKSLFNKTPKICYTEEDVERNYGDIPNVVKILSECLEELEKLNIKEIYQADFLFDLDSLSMKEIDGEEYITFTPNTITYGVKLGTQTAKEVSKAKVGVAVHTMYKGDSISNLSNEKCTEFPYSSKDVYVMPITVKIDNSGNKKLSADYKELETLSKDYDKDFTDNFKDLFAIFSNNLVKNDKLNILSDEKQIEEEFKKFLNDMFQKEKDKRKSEDGKKKIEEKEQSMIAYLDEVDFATFAKLYDSAMKLKTDVLSVLNDSQSDIKTFFKNGETYEPTAHEGFVTQELGIPVKIVNRTEFSKRNFANPKFRNSNEN